MFLYFNVCCGYYNIFFIDYYDSSGCGKENGEDFILFIGLKCGFVGI